MAQVTIKTHAFHDPRLVVAGRAMRLSAPAVGWKLALCWSYVTRANDSVMALDQVAACIGRKPEAVREGLLRAQLADFADDDDVLDLAPMGSLFGDFEWLEDLGATAAAGGKARASHAERDDDGRFQRRDVRQEILDRLADEHPRTRGELVEELHARKARVYREVRGLLTAGVLVEHSGRIALAMSGPRNEPVPVEPAEPVPPTPAEPVPDSPRNPARSSAPAPAPALAPVSTAERESQITTVPGSAGTGGTALSGTEEPGTEEPVEPGTARDLARERMVSMSKVLPRPRRRETAHWLWDYQNALRRQIEPNAPHVQLVNTPGGSLDPVVLALAQYSPAQCVHALDIFAIEAECRRKAGEDALQYLNGRTNWKPEQLARAIGTTAEAMRKRFKARGAPRPGQLDIADIRVGYAPPASNEDFENPSEF